MLDSELCWTSLILNREWKDLLLLAPGVWLQRRGITPYTKRNVRRSWLNFKSFINVCMAWILWSIQTTEHNSSWQHWRTQQTSGKLDLPVDRAQWKDQIHSRNFECSDGCIVLSSITYNSMAQESVILQTEADMVDMNYARLRLAQRRPRHDGLH